MSILAVIIMFPIALVFAYLIDFIISYLMKKGKIK